MFLLHGGADSRLGTETRNSAFDGLLCAWGSEEPTGHHTSLSQYLSGWAGWDALAVLLLKHNAASGYVKGETPLQVALNHGSHRAAALLLRKGAVATPLLQRTFDTERRDSDTGVTLVAFLSASHSHDVVRTLLRRGANPNALPWASAADIERYLDRVGCMHIENKWVSTVEILKNRGWRVLGSGLPIRYLNVEYQDERPHYTLHYTTDGHTTPRSHATFF